jgi:hypothetical protein
MTILLCHRQPGGRVPKAYQRACQEPGVTAIVYGTHEIVRDWTMVSLSPTEFTFASLVLVSREPVPSDVLIDALYGEDENGGPCDADNMLARLAWKINPLLEPLGIYLYSRQRAYRVGNLRVAIEAA